MFKGGIFLKNSILTFGIVILFVSITVSPMVLGYNVKISDNEKTTSSFDSQPIDSAWPMKCYDTRHTSQSPYSTADNPYIDKWRFYNDGWIEDTPVIDSDGTIYFGGCL